MCQELKPIGQGTPISGFKYAYYESCPSGYQQVPGATQSVHNGSKDMRACYTRNSNLAPLRGMAITYVNNSDEWYGNLPGGERILGTGKYNGDLRRCRCWTDTSTSFD